MGSIQRRNGKLYLRYIDADGTERTRLARGCGTIVEARPMLAEIERNILLGKLGVPEPTEEEQARATITVRELGEKYSTEYGGPKIKDPAAYRAKAKGILESRVYDVLGLGVRPAASIRPLDVERLRDALLADGYKPRTATNTMAALSKMYTWGRKQGYVACDNPVRGCERPRAESSIDYLSKAEVAKLLDHAEAHTPDVFPMAATAIYTGMRKGELFGLRWIDVHLDAKRIDVARSYELAPKSGKARHVGIHPDLLPVLRAWKERAAEGAALVFPVDGAMGKTWDGLGLEKIMKAAGCHAPAKPWHSLRHTFASHFMMAGGNVLTLQKLLGHATLEMTLIYAHLAPDFMATELARMSFPRGAAEVASIAEKRREQASRGTDTVRVVASEAEENAQAEATA